MAGEGSEVTPPDGQLTAIEDDNGSVGPNAGGVLEVNSDKLKLTASVDEDDRSMSSFMAGTRDTTKIMTASCATGTI